MWREPGRRLRRDTFCINSHAPKDAAMNQLCAAAASTSSMPRVPVPWGDLLVQSGAWLMRHNDDFAYSTVLLKQARAVKFNNFVAPGNTLNLHVEVQKWDGDLCTLLGRGTVNGGTAVSAKLTLQRFNLADTNPELASSDAYEIRKLKELFTLLWSEPKVPAAP